jgi:hypothetical protein
MRGTKMALIIQKNTKRKSPVLPTVDLVVSLEDAKKLHGAPPDAFDDGVLNVICHERLLADLDLVKFRCHPQHSRRNKK